jgi:hypothetical protein
MAGSIAVTTVAAAGDANSGTMDLYISHGLL